jgi:DNA uptake protein ComE-like DNA-binding protein
LKYREKGGRFNTREELKKIYGLDSAEYSDIEHYILIRADQTDTSEWLKAGSDDTGIARVDFNSRILINLNTADSAELESFYGIGPVLSARIVRYRDLLGGYASKRQLLEVYGMTIENFERIQDYVVADSAEIDFINLNEASLEELSRHPYLTVYQARSLIAYRETNGRFASTEEIVRNDLLPVDVYKKIRPYLVTE